MEEFYRDRNADVMVQVSPAHRHGALDRHLAAKGYELVAPTLVLRAPIDRPGAPVREQPAPCRVDLGERDERWSRALRAVDGRSDAAGELVMDRIPGRTVFAKAVRNGTVVGVGAGVLDEGWFGVFCMGTLAAHRRSGVAAAVLAELAGWARRAGAHTAWLQVEQGNVAARTLYRRVGFRLSHRYHFRRAPAG